MENFYDGAHFCRVASNTQKQLPSLRAHVQRIFDIFDLIIAEYIFDE